MDGFSCRCGDEFVLTSDVFARPSASLRRTAKAQSGSILEVQGRSDYARLAHVRVFEIGCIARWLTTKGRLSEYAKFFPRDMMSLKRK
jgi:hypothetical protein